MGADERDFLDDDVTEEVERETPETPEPEAPEPEAETVENAAETPEPEVPTTPEAKEDRTVPYAAMRAEREKRQRLERELEQLRQAKPEQDVKADQVSFYEDPERYLKQAVQSVEQQATQRIYMALEAHARETYPDYDEVFEEVKEHAASNPAVAHQIFTAPNPAVAAYKLGKQLREFKQMQDPDAYRERIRAELRAELEAERAAKEAAKAKAAAAIPPDLTDTRNAKGGDLPAPETVFDEIF